MVTWHPDQMLAAVRHQLIHLKGEADFKDEETSHGTTVSLLTKALSDAMDGSPEKFQMPQLETRALPKKGTGEQGCARLPKMPIISGPIELSAFTFLPRNLGRQRTSPINTSAW